MKLAAYSDYDSWKVALAESALLTIWPNLEPWHEDLVLVGGLVPRYICGDTSAPRVLPRPVTLDADIGIALAVSAGGMSSLQFALLEKDFHKATSPEVGTIPARAATSINPKRSLWKNQTSWGSIFAGKWTAST